MRALSPLPGVLSVTAPFPLLASPAGWVVFGDVAGDGFGAGSGLALEGADGGVS